MLKFLSSLFLLLSLVACQSQTSNTSSTTFKHRLNIPELGIESIVEANTQKVIEGTDASIVVQIGEVNRKEVSISIRLDDRILTEKILHVSDKLSFDYHDHPYTLHITKIKKPLIGIGKVSFILK
ncbi:MAG: hypothetical protein R2831_03180 [Chitinophagaceae bacterium]